MNNRKMAPAEMRCICGIVFAPPPANPHARLCGDCRQSRPVREVDLGARAPGSTHTNRWNHRSLGLSFHAELTQAWGLRRSTFVTGDSP